MQQKEKGGAPSSRVGLHGLINIPALLHWDLSGVLE